MAPPRQLQVKNQPPAKENVYRFNILFPFNLLTRVNITNINGSGKHIVGSGKHTAGNEDKQEQLWRFLKLSKIDLQNYSIPDCQFSHHAPKLSTYMWTSIEFSGCSNFPFSEISRTA